MKNKHKYDSKRALIKKTIIRGKSIAEANFTLIFMEETDEFIN